MTFSFPHAHGVMLLKYSGISFISGAVNHGFFSGERSLWTAAVGIALFMLGAWQEHRNTAQHNNAAATGLLHTLVVGALLSIGLGFFTGGLQHFPDSPARSAWVVPLGFVISLLALAWSTEQPWRRNTTVYAVVVGLLVTTSSLGAWQWLQQHPEWATTGHSHGETSTHGGPAEPATPVAMQITRSVEVQMDDQMRFTPAKIDVREGETLRFVVRNAGQTDHEMVLGSDADIRAHAQAMQQGAGHAEGHSHGVAAAITVAAGQTGELVVKFDHASTLEMACLIPGHYEAGMRGTVHVQPRKAAHDHSTHTH